jgi:hypothetical protein
VHPRPPPNAPPAAFPPPTYENYIFDEKDTAARSLSSRWCADGEQERCETYPLRKIAPKELQAVWAFDGNVVRKVTYGAEDGPHVSITTPERFRLTSQPRPDPKHLIFQRYGRPWSKMMREANDFSVKSLPGDGPGAYEVSFSDMSTVGNHDVPVSRYVLQLDSQLRIVQRDFYTNMHDKRQRLWERYIFSDWQDYRLNTGEVISFPQKCRVVYVTGVTDDGQLAVSKEELITYTSVKFNETLDDSLFSIDFPPSAAVTNDRKAPPDSSD